MSTALQDLYQEVILDHNKSPRNFRRMDNANRSADGHNPLCGDKIHLYLHIEGDRIQDISFEGSGCAISKASASLMGSALKGKTVQEAHDLFARFHDMVTSKMETELPTEELGKLAVFSGVREFPTRVKCAVLPWHTLEAALKGEAKISTE